MSVGKNIILTGWALFLGACASNPISDTYYSLSLGNPQNMVNIAEKTRTTQLSLARVTLPRFLGKQNLVMQSGTHTLVSAKHHFWAEHLEDGIAKVLAQEIMRVSNNLYVERNSGRWTSKSNCSLRVEFDAFHATEAGQVLSSGRFWLQSSKSDHPVTRAFSTTDDLQSSGYPQVVVQLRTSLQNLSTTIAASVEQSGACN